MNDRVREAILDSIRLRSIAGERQLQRGTSDIGARSQVTSGKHLDPLSEAILDDLADSGFPREGMFNGSNDTRIPGWFRATKKWDILLMNDDELVVAIELKSIFGSYGKNLNNRAEEALGLSLDARFAARNGLMNQTIPPMLGYVMIVREEQGSTSVCKVPRSHFPMDPVFEGTSSVDRFRILCQRLRMEGIYGAVWFVTVNVDSGTVSEPDPSPSYEKFIACIRGRIDVFLS